MSFMNFFFNFFFNFWLLLLLGSYCLSLWSSFNFLIIFISHLLELFSFSLKFFILIADLFTFILYSLSLLNLIIRPCFLCSLRDINQKELIYVYLISYIFFLLAGFSLYHLCLLLGLIFINKNHKTNTAEWVPESANQHPIILVII